MTQPSNLPLPAPTSLHPLAAVAGPPPLIATERERAAGYDELLARVGEALQPSDVLEQLWIRDIVDMSWEVFRLRRAKADLMTAASWEGMAKVLEPLFEAAGSFAKGYAKRKETTLQMIDEALAGAGLTMDHVAAQTLALRIGDIERIDRLMASAEVRRNNALREIDLHRASFGLRLRRTLQAVEDAEFNEVATPAPDNSAEAA